uniref:Transcription termination factor MTERF9, chloroplastic n=1 Tax=Ananas comosus var. bracteatus TaxID=296719 RepID=A0A6V7NDZ0_ANACO|nr:unnamed protein product [Ananas comosus var. bracteatus]
MVSRACGPHSINSSNTVCTTNKRRYASLRHESSNDGGGCSPWTPSLLPPASYSRPMPYRPIVVVVFIVSPTRTIISEAPSSTVSVPEEEEEESEGGGGGGETGVVVESQTPADVFRRWGCTESEVSRILARHPSLSRLRVPLLQAKLEALRGVGVGGPELVKIITCRPRFLCGRVGHGVAARIEFLRSTLFPSDDAGAALLLRAVSRNPSLLTYDVEGTMRPCVALYQSLGKLDLLRRTRLAPAHPMYKYALSVLAISRLDTLRAKLANLEKFGFSCDDVMGLFARTPNVLTLSVDKVQRNMTYIVGTVKLPPRSVLDEPALLYCNLERVLRPRHLLVVKLRQMGLRPTPQVKEPYVVKAVRMPERRFLRSFVTCHEDAVARELMEYYENVKGLRRLAESSRSTRRLGFPF